MTDATRENQIQRRIVEKCSLQYKRLLQLNQNCRFYPGNTRIYRINAKAKSKPDYDTFNFHTFLFKFINTHFDSISDLLNKIYVNEREYKAYLTHIASFVPTPSSTINRYNISQDEFYRTEEIMCREITLSRPNLGIKLVCNVSYTSPKGKNAYSKSEEFIALEIWNLWQQVTNYRNSKCDDTHKKERAKMTQSLRYDILKRDHFRCQICGRSASDDVTLEVDHIIPISKGGKTVPDNLRTLCKDCNRGKRNKFE